MRRYDTFVTIGTMGRNGSLRMAIGADDLGFGAATTASPTRRRGRGLVRLGIAVLVVGVVAFIGGFVLMGVNAFESVRDGIDPQRDLDLSVGVPGNGTVELDADRYQVVALGDTLVAVSGMSSDAGGYTVSRIPFTEPVVTITGPDGAVVDLEPPGHDRLSSTPGLDAVGIFEFTVPTDGMYAVTVAGEAPAVSSIGIDEADSLWESAKPWITSSAVIAIGGVLMTIGVLVLVGGIVRSTLGSGLGDLRRLGRIR
jgi:hypothetical protein